MWIYTAKLPEDQSNHKFAAMSSGMQQLGPNTVARQRTGKFDTDAARWKEGFSSGKFLDIQSKSSGYSIKIQKHNCIDNNEHDHNVWNRLLSIDYKSTTSG